MKSDTRIEFDGKVIRHHVDGDIRFVTPADGFLKLIALHRGGRFVWAHKNVRVLTKR